MSTKRERYIAFQKDFFKRKTNLVLAKYKNERFQIEDDHKPLHNAFLTDKPVDFGVLMAITTRKKIHILVHNALNRMRNHDDNVDLTRLHKLISLHKSQMKKIGTMHYEINAKFYDSMYQAVTTNLHWLRVINRG